LILAPDGSLATIRLRLLHRVASCNTTKKKLKRKGLSHHDYIKNCDIDSLVSS